MTASELQDASRVAEASVHQADIDWIVARRTHSEAELALWKSPAGKEVIRLARIAELHSIKRDDAIAKDRKALRVWRDARAIEKDQK